MESQFDIANCDIKVSRRLQHHDRQTGLSGCGACRGTFCRLTAVRSVFGSTYDPGYRSSYGIQGEKRGTPRNYCLCPAGSPPAEPLRRHVSTLSRLAAPLLAFAIAPPSPFSYRFRGRSGVFRYREPYGYRLGTTPNGFSRRFVSAGQRLKQGGLRSRRYRFTPANWRRTTERLLAPLRLWQSWR